MAKSYLSSKTKEARIKLLKEGTPIPLDLAEDLLLLDLGTDEKLHIISSIEAPNIYALELFLVELTASPVQDIATHALRQWASRTPHLFWYRILNHLNDQILPQRTLYTIIDISEFIDGKRALDLALKREGLEEMSIALHGLLLHRALQFDKSHPRLKIIAEKIIQSLDKNLHPENKALPSGISYLLRHHTETLAKCVDSLDLSESWIDYIKTALEHISKKEKKLPPIWKRAELKLGQIATAKRWQDIAGVSEEALHTALSEAENLSDLIGLTYPLLPRPLPRPFLTKLSNEVGASKNPKKLISKFPASLKTMFEHDADKSFLERIKKEELQYIEGKHFSALTHHDFSEPSVASSNRKAFFDQALRGRNLASSGEKSDFFHTLLKSWHNPDVSSLNELAQVARKEEGVFRLCYIQTLGRFQSRDEAVLKLLDYIRSQDEDDLRAVIKALAGIGTPRAGQEIISMLTRPNLSLANQIEAATLLSRLSLGSLQHEIKVAISEIESRPSQDPAVIQLRDLLRDLLHPDDTPLVVSIPIQSDDSDQTLDTELKRKFADYPSLSGEVKRALRTAQFFHNKVQGENAPGTIDLSPVIDMQYKALELFFRENFEEPCSQLIGRGILQNKLDVIGYARPIPHAMDDFEKYIGSLPIVKTIPFFSAFKLRKMLRAICQFRPGRRFTLDGIKAFALFFLCFSRLECRYNLQSLFPLGFAKDEDLFNFCKELHLMQDFRNRAAHEGFHPEAANDILGIWRSTALIIEIGSKISRDMLTRSEREYAPVNRSNPIIEKKVS